MASFFGNPVLATYTGPTAQQAIEDEQEGQKTAFDQQRQRMMDVQQGRDSGDDNPNPVSQAAGRVGRAVGGLFSGGVPSIPAGTGSNITQPDLDISDPTSGAVPAAGLLATRAGGAAATQPVTPSQTVNGGAGGADLWGMTREDAVAQNASPSGLPGGAPPGAGSSPIMSRRPMAGEFIPSLGRIATTQDGQTYDRMSAAVAKGVPPAGLLATRAGQNGGIGSDFVVHAAGQGAGNQTRTPGTPQPPIAPQPGAQPPAAATRAPAPAPTMPAGSAPASAGPQLMNAQVAGRTPAVTPAATTPQLANAQAQAARLAATTVAPPNPQLRNAQAQAGMPLPDMRASLPNLPDFLTSNGVAPTVSRPGLGTVSRVVPLLQPELEGQTLAARLAWMNAARLGQIDETGRVRNETTDHRYSDQFVNSVALMGPKQQQWLDQQGIKYADNLDLATKREGWKQGDVQAATQSHIAAAEAIKNFGGNTPQARQATVHAALSNLITESGGDPDKAEAFFNTSPDKATLTRYGLTEDGVRSAATSFQQKGDMAAALGMVSHFAANENTVGAKVQKVRAAVGAASGSTAGSAATSRAALSNDQITAAKQDAGYAGYLKSLGYPETAWK